MKQLALLLLCATLLCPLPGMADEAAPASRAISTLTTTLNELGYPSGIVFDDTSVPGEHTLLFHLPMDMRVTSATLRILYRGTPQLSGNASLGVAINDLPPQRITLVADSVSREWLVPVPESALEGGQIKITMDGDISSDYANQTEGEPKSALVRILADTSLTSIHEGLPKSLRDTWLTLPEEVVVSIPSGPVDEPTFRAALDWITLLQRNHRKIRIATLPELGDLAIAPEADIAIALAQMSGQPPSAHSLWSEPGRNIGVVSHDGHSFIAATPPYANVQRFSSLWRALSHPAHIDSAHVTTNTSMPDKVLLHVLGLSTETAMLGHRLQWSATITPWNLPPGMRPEQAKIHLVMPRTDTNKMFRVFVYLNDMMIKSARFAGDGVERQITASFGSIPRNETYHLRVVVRDGSGNDAGRQAKQYPIRITPQSHITVSKETREPVGLSSVPTAFGQGFALYMPSEYLSSAPRYLPLLGQLLAGFAVPQVDYKLVVLSFGHIPKPEGNFIVAGDIPLGESTLPVRFDEGKVQLIDAQGDTLISERRLRMGNVIQLMNYKGMTGIWFHPGETGGMPAIDANRLGSDDVAIYEADKLAMSIDSTQEDLAHLQYPEAPRWYERLYNQRFIWVFSAWGFLTLGIVYLNAKSKGQRNS